MKRSPLNQIINFQLNHESFETNFRKRNGLIKQLEEAISDDNESIIDIIKEEIKKCETFLEDYIHLQLGAGLVLSPAMKKYKPTQVNKPKIKTKGKSGRPKGKSLKTIQRYNWIRDKYYILQKKRSGSTYEEFADLIYSELREKTPHYFDKSYKKSTILKVLKNKLWTEE